MKRRSRPRTGFVVPPTRDDGTTSFDESVGPPSPHHRPRYHEESPDIEALILRLSAIQNSQRQARIHPPRQPYASAHRMEETHAAALAL